MKVETKCTVCCGQDPFFIYWALSENLEEKIVICSICAKNMFSDLIKYYKNKLEKD